MSIQRSEFTQRVRSLGLPEGGFIVIGSGILAVLGIRAVSDVDLAVDEATYATLVRSDQWTQEDTGHGVRLVNADHSVEVWCHWSPAPGGVWRVDELLRDAVYVDEVPFISLERSRQWKLWRGRPKDVQDIALIDDYQKRMADERA